jgi:hypothetical protein
VAQVGHAGLRYKSIRSVGGADVRAPPQFASLRSKQLSGNYKSAIKADGHDKFAGPIERQTAAEAAQRSKLTWVQQTNKARALLAKAAAPAPAHAKPVSKRIKHEEMVARRSKVEKLVEKRQKAIAARVARLQGKLSEKQMASKMLMQGAKAHKAHKLKGFRPVHLFGGEFAKQEAAREHKRSAGQELSHLTKLNDEIFGAAPQVHWKVQSADQELASFGSLNKRVIGAKRYAHRAADTAAKELAQDSAINARVFPKSSKARAAFKGVSAASELKHLKAVDARVVPKVPPRVRARAQKRGGRQEGCAHARARVCVSMMLSASHEQKRSRRTCRRDIRPRV